MICTKITRILWLCLSIIVFCNDVVLSSLLEGTLVATAHGLVPIQNLKVGDKILGYDLKKPNYNEALCEVAVTKLDKHLTDSLFTMCTENGWVEASPHQLLFTLIPTSSKTGDARVMDFVQAQDITKAYMLIDVHMNCLAIGETNKLELSCSSPDQYTERVKRNRHKKVTKVARYVINADVYALEVEEPHVFLIAENPYAKDMSKTRLLLTHNGIPALAAGISFAFDSTPASLSFAEATASVGGLGVVFGPVGVALGVVTGLGYIGYQLFKSDSKSQSSFYIERAGPSSPGGMDPKEPKGKKDKDKAIISPNKKDGDEKIIDNRMGKEVGRFIADNKGNIMIEPVGGSTVAAGKDGLDTHTTYPNGSNYQRYNPNGHPPKSNTPHGHGHLEGTGPGMKGQGPSIDVHGNTVPFNTDEAHWPLQ